MSPVRYSKTALAFCVAFQLVAAGQMAQSVMVMGAVVQPGLPVDGGVEILSGLRPGDVILPPESKP